MNRLRLIAAAALLTACSGVAHADNGILEYIESWSGPGPYAYARGFDVNVYCLRQTTAPKVEALQAAFDCHTDNKQLRAMFTFKWTRGDNGNNQLFIDDRNDKRLVTQNTYEALFIYRLNSILDVGGGLQLSRLSDDLQQGTPYTGSTLWRTGPAVRVTVTPFGALNWPFGLSRLVHVQYESAFFGGTSQALDYGNPISNYSAQKEFQSRVALGIDLAPVYYAIFRH